MKNEEQREAERDGYADGRENVTWRADRHPVTCRESYERGFQRGQRRRLADEARLELHKLLDESAATREP